MPSKAAVEMADRARALARNECRDILRALGARRRVHVSVHQARKTVRKLRALLALVAGRLPEAVAIDRVLKRVGDGLSPLRDAHVAVETARHFSRGHRQRWTTAINRLTERRDALLARVLAQDPRFERRRALLRRIVDRLDSLDWENLRMSDLRSALHDSRRRAAKAKHRSDNQPSAEKLHRWRRRVRKLRFQVEVIAEIAPTLAKRELHSHPGRQAKALHRLSDQLGAQRDADMLQRLLKRLPALPNRSTLLLQLQGKPIPLHGAARSRY